VAFAPGEFADVADHLSAHRNPREGCLRAAVSRSYYAAFLSLKERLLFYGYDFPQHRAHQRLLDAIEQSGDPQLRPVRKALWLLKKRRGMADYDLDEEFREADVRKDLEKGRRLLNHIQQRLTQADIQRIGNTLPMV